VDIAQRATPSYLFYQELLMSNTLPSGVVTGPNLISSVGELTLQDFDDLTNCTHIATRSADLVHNRFANSQYWLDEYVRTLMFLGWSLHEGAITTRIRFDVSGSVADFLVRKAQALSDSGQANAMIDTLDALRPDIGAVRSLDDESLKGRRFQVLPARYDSSRNLHIAVFNLELVANETKNGFLFWSWEKQSANLVQQSAFLKLNRAILDTKRPLMETKLREQVMKRFTLRKVNP
jgi:hypothetical protein